MMLIKLAWKNVWRNKTRSLIVILSITIGTIAGIFICAWMNGMIKQLVRNSIYTETGHLQITNPNYIISEDIEDTLTNIPKIKTFLCNNDSIKAFSLHSRIIAMAQTPYASAGVILNGIDPQKEKEVSDISNRLIFGNYFEKNDRFPHIIIGNKLAENLRIKTYKFSPLQLKQLKNSELPNQLYEKLQPLKGKRFLSKKKIEKVLSNLLKESDYNRYKKIIEDHASYYNKRARITFSFTNMDNDLTYLTCRVEGIYKSSSTPFDAENIFIKKRFLDRSANMGANTFHTATIIAKKELEPDERSNILPLKHVLQNNLNGMLIRDIKQLAPEAYSFQMMNKPMMIGFMGIIYFALAFGIINTMTMAILERIHEFGMLMAIGIKRKRIALMVGLETFFLILIGAITGMTIALLLVQATAQSGINLLGNVSEDYGISAVIYPEISSALFFSIVVIIILVSLISTIIPIHRALKAPIAEAIQEQ